MKETPSKPHEDRHLFKEELADDKLREVCHLLESGSALQETTESKGDEIPPMPEGMREKFIEQYGDTVKPSPRPSPNPHRESAGLFNGFLDWIGGRGLAFGALAGAAAAVLILFSVYSQRGEDPGTDLFRGHLGQSEMAKRLLFYQIDTKVTERLIADYLEPDATTSAEEMDQLQDFLNTHLDAVRIVINASTESVERYEPGALKPSRAEPFVGLLSISATDDDGIDRLFQSIVDLMDP